VRNVLQSGEVKRERPAFCSAQPATKASLDELHRYLEIEPDVSVLRNIPGLASKDCLLASFSLRAQFSSRCRMTHFARLLSAILGCAAFLVSSPPAQARNIFEIIFGPPAGSHTRRAHSARHAARPTPTRRAPAAKPVGPPVIRAQSVWRAARPTLPGRTSAAKRPIGQPEAGPAVMTDAELVTSILTDPTLRRGDIVEFSGRPTHV
jgi:hypothetical protein